MNFTEFRSKSLRALWKALAAGNVERDYVCRVQWFSTWRIDDICANQWRGNQTDISGCVQELEHYIRTEVLLEQAEYERSCRPRPETQREFGGLG